MNAAAPAAYHVGMTGFGTVMVALAFAQGAQDVVERLATTRVTLDVREADLPDVVRVVGDATGIPLHIAPGAPDSLRADERRVTLRVRDVSARSLLSLVLKPRGLTLTLRGGLVWVVPEDDLEGAVVTRAYDASDLALWVEDYPIPQPYWGIVPGYRGPGAARGAAAVVGMDGTGLGLAGEWGPGVPIYRLPYPEGTQGNRLDPAELAELVRIHTGGDSWSEHDGVAAHAFRGKLVVAQTAAVHAEIGRLLAGLRETR